MSAVTVARSFTSGTAADAVKEILDRPIIGPVAKVVLAFAGTYGAIALFALSRGKSVPQGGPLVYGAIIGLLYGMVSFGLILVYRANRFVNFAQAEIGAAAAVFSILLVKLGLRGTPIHHVPYLAALPIAIVIGGASGFLGEILLRRFSKAPRLVLTVASIGLALLFALVQIVLPTAMGGKLIDPTPPRTPFTRFTVEIYPQVFNGNHFLVPFVVGAVMVGLTFFFKKTDVGMAIRGSAENAERALLLGISVRKLSSYVWVIAGALSALGVFLRIPLIGIPVGADVGPSVLLFGLTAAVIAKFDSFPVALGAAVVLGVVEQAIYVITGDPNVGKAVLLPVLLIAMLTQKGKLSRGQDTGLSSFRQATEFRPIPPELVYLPEVQWAKYLTMGLPLGLAILLPYVVGIEQQILGGIVLIYAIVAVSLVILTGWAGQISLGQWGFAGVGALVAGGMASHLHADFFLSLVVAGLAGAAASLIIGLPALRIQGLYLAVTTLAFGLAVQAFLLSPLYFERFLPTATRPINRPLLYGHFSTDGPRAMYFLCLGTLVLCIASATALRKSRTGRAMIAARDNERGAQSYGVSVSKARIAAFAISGFWAAVAGALYAYHQKTVETVSFSYDVNLLLLVIVVIGGVTSVPGALLGTAWIGILRYGGFSSNVQILGSAVGVLALLYFLPGGLAQAAYGLRDAYLRTVAERRGIIVPSLLADARDEAAPPDVEGERHGVVTGLTNPSKPFGGGLAAASARLADPATPGGAVSLMPAPMLRRAVECPVCRVLVPLAGIDGHEHFQVVDL